MATSGVDTFFSFPSIIKFIYVIKLDLIVFTNLIIYKQYFVPTGNVHVSIPPSPLIVDTRSVKLERLTEHC